MGGEPGKYRYGLAHLNCLRCTVAISPYQQAGDLESLNIKALQQRALELWEVDQTSALELGRALIAVRDAMREEHGAFAKWYRGNGLEENRVYYCIRRAEGKSSPTFEPEQIRLNRNTLMLAKYAPP